MFNKGAVRKQILFSGIAFAVIALLFGLWSHYNINNKGPKEINLKSGTAFVGPKVIKPFELQNAPTGAPFKNNQLKGRWSMMFFGFTHCAMLCPTTLSALNQFYTTLSKEDFSALPQVYFISIDPDRDSLLRVDQYVTSFNKNFKGATGTEAQLDHLTQELNILFAKVKTGQEDEDYQIDHSGTVLVFNPEGQLAALFSPPLDPKVLAEDYKTLVKDSQKGV